MRHEPRCFLHDFSQYNPRLYVVSHQPDRHRDRSRFGGTGLMTTTLTEDLELGSALALLWQRHRQTNLDRISLLEMTTANVLRSMIDDASVAEGISAAHKLAGSLGTFGFDAGSRAALEAESLLREPVIDPRLLAEAVAALRASVEDGSDVPEAVAARVPSTVSTTKSIPA